MSKRNSKKTNSPLLANKYQIGARVLLKIGDRPIMPFTVLSFDLTQKCPRYKINWGEHGFNEILNTVFIPETSFLGPA